MLDPFSVMANVTAATTVFLDTGLPQILTQSQNSQARDLVQRVQGCLATPDEAWFPPPVVLCWFVTLCDSRPTVWRQVSFVLGRETSVWGHISAA